MSIFGCLGSLSWARWQRELAVLSDMLYFGLTTVCGYQTLGEEYCNIVQVDSSGRKIPSLAVRLIENVCMHVCVCMFACMSVCVFVRLFVCLSVCIHVCVFVCLHVCIRVSSVGEPHT